MLRPVGPVNLLISIKHSGIHPHGGTGIDIYGNLRLLRKAFGSGNLLDGWHSAVHSIPHLMISEEPNRLSHSLLGQTNYTESEGNSRVIHVQRRKKCIPFHDTDKMEVSQP